MAACAGGLSPWRDSAVATTPPETRPDADSKVVPIPRAEAETLAELQQQSAQALARRVEYSIPAAEHGYYLDVLQAALQRIRDDRFSVQRDGAQLLVTLGGSTFESGRAALTVDAQSRLVEIANVLEEYAATLVVVHGHTDSSGTEELNRVLSQRRAEAVARELQRHGVAAVRLLAVGHGSARPVADNATPEGQQANRRVELYLQTVRREGS